MHPNSTLALQRRLCTGSATSVAQVVVPVTTALPMNPIQVAANPAPKSRLYYGYASNTNMNSHTQFITALKRLPSARANAWQPLVPANPW